MEKYSVVTLETSKEGMEVVQKNYASFLLSDIKLDYVLFQAKKDNLVITCYQSKKSSVYKIVFQGPNATNEAELYQAYGTLHYPIEKKDIEYDDIGDQIGSDEVGVGDFISPMIVCAVYMKKEDYDFVKKSGITDSKKLTDQKIMEIVPPLLDHFTFSLMVLTPIKYNEMVDKGFNLNKLKAWLHNHALYNVKEKSHHITPIYVDQFCEDYLYYRYLEDADHIVKGITFKTKGETHYPSVALASCFARYYFLKYMQDASERLGATIPLGASKDVTEFAYQFYLKQGDSFLDNYTKKNFKNYNEIKERK